MNDEPEIQEGEDTTATTPAEDTTAAPVADDSGMMGAVDVNEGEEKKEEPSTADGEWSAE